MHGAAQIDIDISLKCCCLVTFAEGYLLTMAYYRSSSSLELSRPFGNLTDDWTDSWTPWSWDEWTSHGWGDYWTPWNQWHQWSEAGGDSRRETRGSQPCSRTSQETAIDATNTKKSRGAWAAGVVAISMQSLEHCVCLVHNKNDGTLGFPKGRANAVEDLMSSGGHMATAMREWQEETNLPAEGLTLMMDADAAKLYGDECHYFMAKWDPTELSALPGDIQPLKCDSGVMTSCRIKDDKQDSDPIVRAYWMECSAALELSGLSARRKDFLRKTIRYLTLRLSFNDWIEAMPNIAGER